MDLEELDSLLRPAPRVRHDGEVRLDLMRRLAHTRDVTLAILQTQGGLMLEEALATLAMTGATTVVAAMATQAWQTTRTGVLQLFRRDQAQRPAIATQLDGDATLVAQEADSEGARQDLVPIWNRRLAAFLRQHPDALEELQILVNAVRAELPQAQQRWVQHITAHGGIAAGAQGPGSGVYIHNYPGPGQARPATPAPDDNTGDVR